MIAMRGTVAAQRCRSCRARPAPARRRRRACARASPWPARSRAARSTISGNETTNTLMANVSSAERRARRPGSQRVVAPARGARTRPRCARPPRAGVRCRRAPRPRCARTMRIRAEADRRAGARDRLAQQLHELGVDAHVGAVDLERDVARGGELGQAVEPPGQVARHLGPADGEPQRVRDDVVAAVLDGVAEAREVVVPGTLRPSAASTGRRSSGRPSGSAPSRGSCPSRPACAATNASCTSRTRGSSGQCSSSRPTADGDGRDGLARLPRSRPGSARRRSAGPRARRPSACRDSGSRRAARRDGRCAR